MKFLICLFISLFVFPTFAMKGSIAIRKPVGSPVVLDTSATNVTAAAWVELIATTTYACSAIQIHNTGAQPIKIGVGAATAEADQGGIFPVGVSMIVPVEISKGVRIAVRSIGGTQSSGLLTWACFQ